MDDSRTKKEIEDKQVSDILEKTNNILEESVIKLEKQRDQLDDKNKNLAKEIIESKQENMLTSSTHISERKRFNKNRKITTMTIAIACMISIIAVMNPFTDETIHMKSNYVISNLRGDTIDTWLTWRLTQDSPIHVSIVNADEYSDEKIQLIKDALLSDKIDKIDSSLLGKGDGDSTLYYGWQSALSDASETKTKFFIPNKIRINESELGEGEIIIRLTNLKNSDGFSGWTKSIADDTQNQILKSEIIIYEADKISDEDLVKLVRHEFGHALGLGHSTAKEDLMYETIDMKYPMISECDIQVLTALYDGSQSSRVFCET